MNTKHNQRSRNTIEKITQAYLELINAFPDKRVKVMDLCQKAHINRATFYAHYYNVDELSEQMVAEMMTKMKTILTHKALDRFHLETAFTQLFQLILDNQIFFYHYFIVTGATKSLSILKEAPIVDAIQVAEQQAQKDPITFSYDIVFFNAGMSGMIKTWLQHQCDTPIPTLVHILNSKLEHLSD